jgi:hypothetical protein
MSQFIYPPGASTGGASEATAQDQLTELQAINSNTADAATETTLAALNAKVAAVDTGNVVVVSAPLPADAATETTLAALAAEDFATEATLSSLEAKDFATETTLANLDATQASALPEIQNISTVMSEFQSDGIAVKSSVLPTGAATSAAQTTGNNSLASIDGKITAVNTGAVVVASSALPTGAATLAEQQTQTASLSVLDDWDESDRAKVNPIAGQAGVQAGAGAVSANTQRVVIATDQTSIPVDAAPLIASGSDSLASALDEIILPCPGAGTLQVNVDGTWTGFVVVQISLDGGVTYTAVPMQNRTLGDGQNYMPLEFNGLHITTISGATHVKVNGSLVSSGSADVQVGASEGAGGLIAGIESYLFTQTNIRDGNGMLLESSAVDPVGTEQALIVRNIPMGLTVVDQIDTTPLLDTASTNIPASASNPVEVVAATAGITKKIVSVEDIGEFIGVYTGAALSETLLCVLPLGGGEIEVTIAAGERISLRNMKNATINSGTISLNFLG